MGLQSSWLCCRLLLQECQPPLGLQSPGACCLRGPAAVSGRLVPKTRWGAGYLPAPQPPGAPPRSCSMTMGLKSARTALKIKHHLSMSACLLHARCATSACISVAQGMPVMPHEGMTA